MSNHNDHPAQPPPENGRPIISHQTGYFRWVCKRKREFDVYFVHRMTDQMNKVAYNLTQEMATAMCEELNDILAKYNGHYVSDRRPAVS